MSESLRVRERDRSFCSTETVLVTYLFGRLRVISETSELGKHAWISDRGLVTERIVHDGFGDKGG